jgi:hypothetical protein
LIFKLIYTTKTIIIQTLRDAFDKDPLINPYDGVITKPAIPKIVDGWQYQIREFPAIVITSSTAANRRAGIGDYVTDVFIGDEPTNENLAKERRGGWFDMTLEITAIGRNTVEREQLIDKTETFLWFTRKTDLRNQGIVVLDIAFTGEYEEPWGKDFLYGARLTLSTATEWEHDTDITKIKKLSISQKVELKM